MEPKMLKLLRALLGLDDKVLPDSMTTEDFGKFLEDQKGKLVGNPEDIKNLQKIISQKDVDFQKVSADFEKYKKDLTNKDDSNKSELEKKFAEMGKNFETLTKQLGDINKGNEKVALQKEYPDILPEILVGKTAEEKKVIVDSQRAINKKNYGDSKHFTQPTYTDVKEIDQLIDDVKNDKSITGERAAVKVLQLGRERQAFVDGSLES